MKNIKNITLLLLSVFILGSCEDGVNSFSEQPTVGWVEFASSQTSTGQTSTSVAVPLTINVPVYANGLNIAYNIVAVEGDFTNFVTATNGTVYADPEADTRTATLELGLINMEAGRDFVTSFDIVLSTVDEAGVQIGVDEGSIVSHRVTIPCSNPEVLPSDYFVGEYVLADLDAILGPGNGTENFASGTYTLTIDASNPNIRRFDCAILPAFNPTLQPIALTFTLDNVVSLGNVFSGIGCSAPEYIYGDAGAANSSWDVCNDQFIIINYAEDVNTSCGGPFTSSFTLTKVN
jgi:hypothetical protein